jgi:hypothetical protein
VCARGAYPAWSSGPSTSPLGAMPNLTTLAVVFAGFFAGVVWNQLFTRALRLLFTLLGRNTGEPQKFAPKRHSWAIPLLLLHPACWLLLGILYLGYLTAAGRVAAIWGWFVGSFFLSIVVMWAVVLVTLHRLKLKRSRGAGA